MIIFLYGKDNYRLREKMDEIVAQYKKKHRSGLNIVFFGEKSSFGELYDEVRQVSMFDEKRLLVVPNAASNEKLKKEIITNVESLVGTDNIILLFEEGEVKKNDKLLTFFSGKAEEAPKEVICQEFKPLTEKKLLSWIEKKFKKSGVEVEKEAIHLLSRAGGEDLWRIKNEIDKLSLYKKKIKKEDVESLVNIGVETNIFKTIDALAQKDQKGAALYLYDHLRKGDNPHYIFAMIAYQFRNLLTVGDLLRQDLSYEETRKRSKLHPYVFRKTYRQAKLFSYERLVDLYERLFEIDLKTKTGQIDPVLALHMFLFELSS